MAVSIGDATNEHLRGIHQLVLEWGYPASESDTRQWLESLISSPSHQVVVAVADGSVNGWAVTEKRILPGEGAIAEITGLVVRSGCRRSGIGQRLAKAAEDWSRSLGLSRMLVRSNVYRLESHEFYPVVGFEFMKTTKVYGKELTHNSSASFKRPA